MASLRDEPSLLSGITMFTDRRIRTSTTALVFDLALTGFRIGLAWLTASMALTADALHSITDALVSFALLLSMIYRFKQEQTGCEVRIHRAKKAEAIAVVFVALMILAVPFEIYQQTQSMQSMQINNAWWGIAGIGVVMLVLLFIAKLKMLVGIETDSEALKADSQHTKVDLLTSAAVLLSLVGSLVGFNIDQYVALLIAVMIFYAGIELLNGGVRTFLGHGTDQQSIVSICYQGLVTYIPHIPLQMIASRVRAIFRKGWKPVTLAFVVGYMFSGITIVPHGYVGVQSRFGEIIDKNIDSGLLLAWPAPIDEVTLLAKGKLYSISIGSKNSFMRPSYGSKLWYSIKQSEMSRENADYLLTGDEKLMFFTADVQYRIREPSTELTQFSSVEKLLTSLANAVLVKSSTKQDFDRLQQQGFNDYADGLANSISQEVALFELPVDIVSVKVQQIEPPAYLVAKYRDALDAYQESHTLVNQANAWSLTEIPAARAEFYKVKSNATAEANQRIYSVEGETERFKHLAGVYRQSPLAYRFNQQVDIAEETLKHKPFTVIDPAFSSLDFRIWGTAGASNDHVSHRKTANTQGEQSDSLLAGFDPSITPTTANQSTTKPSNGSPYYQGLSERERQLDAEQRELLNKLRVFSTGRSS
ncbi:cation transporter [Vibrio sp. SCSIO 43136]|uniref:cation transporter n=1 Tax=Vibrio sp. SCSIO 43136 TaxID=2819101 RepID=UPI00207505FB|nr:cation transporter [Vibrio sp. SCSIO 43136]USD67138.1 cation transporter [Vibrio sp. SCSIO 43136]